MPTVSTESIKAAILGYHHRIDALNALLNATGIASHAINANTALNAPDLGLLGINPAHGIAEVAPSGKKRRQLTLDQRKHMQKAQRARWAVKRAEQAMAAVRPVAKAAAAAPVAETPNPGKKFVSIATRKKLALAQKEYWANKRAAAVATGKKAKKPMVAGASA